MVDVVEWIKVHALELWGIWGAIITIASIIVKLTPSQKDDSIFNIIIKILNALALNPTKKDTLEDTKKEVKEELDERNDNTTRDNLVNVLE